MPPTKPGIRTHTIIMSPGRVITTAGPGPLIPPPIPRQPQGRRPRPPNLQARNIKTPPEADSAQPVAASAAPRAAAFPDATPGHFAAARLAREGRGSRAYVP